MLVIERGHGILHRHTRKISPVNSKQFSGELAAEIPCTDGTGQLTVHARNYKGILKE
ncbi:MAG: hypothetical protein KKG47_09220 [Proteobacteria bacterium]|nr:hypothetical protein [Pseudomonadota bacterium]MBU1737156.1 hypothetical protein [Pseudomonadota bacterium]